MKWDQTALVYQWGLGQYISHWPHFLSELYASKGLEMLTEILAMLWLTKAYEGCSNGNFMKVPVDLP